MIKANPEANFAASPQASDTVTSRDVASLTDLYHFTRRYSESICEPLTAEDYGLQATASTSPAKWHLAHTSWFFETFILKPHCPGYQLFHASFEYLFNSY